LVFEVEPSPAFHDLQWDLAAIPDLPDTAQQGYPFATTLEILLNVAK
jgi:hypothetical protein